MQQTVGARIVRGDSEGRGSAPPAADRWRWAADPQESSLATSTSRNPAPRQEEGTPVRILVIALAFLVGPTSAVAQTISGHVRDHEGNALPGIIVAYNLSANVQQDTTDAAGAYLLSFGTSSVPEDGGPRVRTTTWGSLKAGFREGLAAQGEAAAGARTVVYPDTLYFDGMSATAEPHYWSIRHAFTATGGDDVVNAATVPFLVTIPNAPNQPPGPTDVTVIPSEFKDYFDKMDGTINMVLWRPGTLPVEYGNYYLSGHPEYSWNEQEYNQIKAELQAWEVCRFGYTGALLTFRAWNNRVTDQQYLNATNIFVSRKGGVNNTDYVLEDGLFIKKVITTMSTAWDQNNTLHEGAWRAFQRYGDEVTTYVPSIGQIPANEPDPRDVAFMTIGYALQDRRLSGQNDISAAEYAASPQ